jgi:hypothetical protein
MSQQPKTNTLAIISLICGILSLPLLFCCYGMPFNLIGLVTGIIALSQTKGDPEGQTGRGLAIGGIATSLLSLVGSVLMLVFAIAIGSAGML